MQITTDQDGYVENFAVIGEIDGGIEVPDIPEAELESFGDSYRAYKLENGRLVYDEKQAARITKEKTISEIRRRRELECFPVVNRGSPWYDRLTLEQREELASWYQAWLDAPGNGVIPEPIAWLDVTETGNPP